MSTTVRLIFIVWLTFLLNLTSTSLYSQITDASHKYVVTAVFLKQSDAEAYIGRMSNQGLEVKFLKHNYPDKRTLYYCYTYVSKDLDQSLSESNKLRATDGFEKTWVFVVLHDDQGPMVAEKEEEPEQEEPEEEETEETAVTEEEEELGGIESSSENVLPDEPEVEEIADTEAVKYFKVKVNTFNSRSLETVPATIKVVDGIRSTLVASLKSNEMDSVKERANGRHQVEIVCEAVGYKKVSHGIDLDNPINDTTSNYAKMENGVLEVEFPLQELKAGDYQILYNIYFYNDASIMKPHSKFELESLHKLMEDRGEMKIRIHGHTNGKSFGKIVKLEDDDTNWFTMTANNKTTSGSAVELSKLRGETIKRYLVSNGIAEDRLEVKGWGGKKMIHEETHPLAHQNVRVEIEVIED